MNLFFFFFFSSDKYIFCQVWKDLSESNHVYFNLILSSYVCFPQYGVSFIVLFFLPCHPLPPVLLCELRLSGVKRSRAWSFTSIKGFMFGEGSDLMAWCCTLTYTDCLYGDVMYACFITHRECLRVRAYVCVCICALAFNPDGVSSHAFAIS